MSNSTTTETIDLTTEQLVNLLNNVYGLVDEYSVLYSTDEYSFNLEDGWIELRAPEGAEILSISTNGASVKGSILTVVLIANGELEALTLLATANGKDLIN